MNHHFQCAIRTHSGFSKLQAVKPTAAISEHIQSSKTVIFFRLRIKWIQKWNKKGKFCLIRCHVLFYYGGKSADYIIFISNIDNKKSLIWSSCQSFKYQLLFIAYKLQDYFSLKSHQWEDYTYVLLRIPLQILIIPSKTKIALVFNHRTYNMRFWIYFKTRISIRWLFNASHELKYAFILDEIQTTVYENLWNFTGTLRVHFIYNFRLFCHTQVE